MIKKVKKKTSNFFRISVFAVVLLGFAATSVLLPVWQVKDIVVEGNEILPEDIVLKKAAISTDSNIFFLNYRDITERIKTIPQVKKAWVSGKLPSSVVIKVEERKPFAVVIAGGDYIVVDDEGIIIPVLEGISISQAKTEELPTVVNLPKEAIIDNKRINSATIKVVRESFKTLEKLFEKSKFELDVGNKDNVAILIDDFLKVKLGDFEDIDKKLFNLSSILNKIAGKRAGIEYIDLRAIGLPVVKFKK